MDNDKYLYSAFISYRHVDPDQEIARRIQHSIETFSIPRALQNSSGNSRHFRKVFRDSDELSLDRDLSSGIDYALSQSEFLIVVLSPQYKESPWCLHEIDEFLKTHDRKNILCVLADGEPADVLPESLTKAPSDDGSGKMIDCEPLCADFRLDRTTARRLELPRILCSMLGCSYDDLIKRQEIYRRRQYLKFGAVAAAVIFVIIFLQFRNLLKLNIAYEAAVYNGAQSLAVQSLERLSEYDRKNALSLGIEAISNAQVFDGALPPESVYALTKSTYAYQPAGFAQTKSRSMHSLIQKYAVTPEHDRIITMDTGAWVMVQSDSGDLLSYWQIDGDDPFCFGFTVQDEDHVLAWRGGNIYSYDYLNYTRDWCMTISEKNASDTDQQSASSDLVRDVSLHGTSECVALTGNCAALVSLSDGSVTSKLTASEILEHIEIVPGSENSDTPFDLRNCSLILFKQYAAPEGEVILSGDLNVPGRDLPLLCIAVWDPASGKVRAGTYDLPSYCISVTSAGRDDIVAVTAEGNDMMWDMLYFQDELFSSEFQITHIICFDKETCEMKWEYDTEMPQVVVLPQIDYIAPSNSGQPALVSITFEVDNYTFALDSGELYFSATLPDSVIMIDRTEDQYTSFYCSNHMCYTIDNKNGRVTESEGLRPFPEEALAAIRINGHVLAVCDNTIYWFDTISDPLCLGKIETGMTGFCVETADIGDDLAAIIVDDNLLVADIKSQKLVKKVDLRETLVPGLVDVWRIAGVLHDQSTLILAGMDFSTHTLYLASYNNQNDEPELLHSFLYFEHNDLTENWFDSFVFYEGTIYAVSAKKNNAVLYYNAVTGQSGEISVKGMEPQMVLASAFTDYVSGIQLSVPVIAISPDGEYLFSSLYDPSSEKGSGAVINLETGEATIIDSVDSYSSRSCDAVFNEDHSLLACSTDYEIMIFKNKYTEEVRIPIRGIRVEAMTWYNNELFVVSSSQTVRRYSVQGKLLTEIKLDHSYQSSYVFNDIKWIPLDESYSSNGALMLIMNGEMNVIDLDEAASMPLMYIPGFLAWSNESDTFMILNTKSVDAEGHQSTPEMSFYLYRHLTPDELLDKGTQQLEEMSQE